MKDIDEAIQHCIEIAEDEERNTGRFYDKEIASYKKKCNKCAADHRQLAEWLRELKQYKEKDKEISLKDINTDREVVGWQYQPEPIGKEQESEEDEIISNNLCDSCTNIGCEFQSGIVRTKCTFYMPPHIEPDNCGNYIVMHQQS